MHSFLATEKGERIIRESGLDDLAGEISGLNLRDTFPVIAAVTMQAASNGPNFEELERIKNDSVSMAAAYAADCDELRILNRGLSVSPDDKWKYLNGDAEQTLFPCQDISTLCVSIPEDRLVVSGVAGVVFQGYASKYPILDRQRSREFGFSSHLEACAFVGAHLIAEILDNQGEGEPDAPSFVIEKGNLHDRITVESTPHGDFILGSTQTVREDSISPTGSRVHFSPQKAVGVQIYHLDEPHIVAVMIRDKCRRNGVQAAIELVDSFSGALREKGVSVSSADHKKKLSSLPAGLGCRVISSTVATEEEWYSNPYVPQSETLFIIEPTDEGLRFMNRSGLDLDANQPIDIPSKYYVELFELLMMQPGRMLGGAVWAQYAGLLLSAQKTLHT